jgi:hypothetical protein
VAIANSAMGGLAVAAVLKFADSVKRKLTAAVLLAFSVTFVLMRSENRSIQISFLFAQ